MGRHLENRRPNLRSLGHRGLIDGGGEKRYVVVDIWGEGSKGTANMSLCRSLTECARLCEEIAV